MSNRNAATFRIVQPYGKDKAREAGAPTVNNAIELMVVDPKGGDRAAYAYELATEVYRRDVTVVPNASSAPITYVAETATRDVCERPDGLTERSAL